MQGNGFWLTLGTIVAVGSFAVTVAMHIRSEGKSSPLAALAFFVFGPILGVLISIPYAVKEAMRDGKFDGRAADSDDALAFTVVMIAIGLLASAVTASIVAYEQRDYF